MPVDVEQSQTQEGTGSGLCFLVVEDHAFQRRILVHTLRGLGADAVHEAEDGRAALEILRSAGTRVDVVISDLWMPGMDGLAFVRELGATASRVSVILSSALDADTRDAVAAEARGGGVRLLGTLDKPLTAEKLEPLIALHRARP